MTNYIYTAMMGDTKDRIRPLPAGMTGLAFVTPNFAGYKASGWTNIVIDTADPVRTVRRFKMDPTAAIGWLEMDDITLWLDASFEITGSLKPLRDAMGLKDALFLKHPFHANLEAEATALKARFPAQAQAIDQIVAKHLKSLVMVKTATHTVGGILVRRHNASSMLFNTIWGVLYRDFPGCNRDQMHMTMARLRAGSLGMTSEILDVDYSKATNYGFKFHKA
jgi:hypothetical protein